MEETLIAALEEALADRWVMIDEVLKMLRRVFGKLEFNLVEWSSALQSGEIKVEAVAAALMDAVRAASGIVTPVPAQNTGLIPDGFEVEEGSDVLEGEVSIALPYLDYSYCPVIEGEDDIGGDTMLKRAQAAQAYGSLGFTSALLKAQSQGREIFPVESRGIHWFIMPCTILHDEGFGSDRERVVAYFFWNSDPGLWEIRFINLNRSFSSRFRFVCSRKTKLLAA